MLFFNIYFLSIPHFSVKREKFLKNLKLLKPFDSLNRYINVRNKNQSRKKPKHRQKRHFGIDKILQ